MSESGTGHCDVCKTERDSWNIREIKTPKHISICTTCIRDLNVVHEAPRPERE